MYLVGKLTITKVSEKEYEGRKYFKCTAIGDDKEPYNVSLSADKYPRVGDVFQMVIEPSDKDFKPTVKLTQEK